MNRYRAGRFPALAAQLPAALVGAVMVYVYAVADAALLFAVAFPERLGEGLGMTLAGALIAGVVVALRSSFDGALGGSQGGVVVMMAGLGIGVQSGFGPDADPDAVFATVIACFVLLTAFIALGSVLIARLGLGRFVRYLPWPVLAGFLVGTGLVLIVAAGPVATGAAPWTLFGATLNGHLQMQQSVTMVLTLVLGGLLFTASRHGPPAALPALVILSCLGAVSHALLMPARGSGWTLVDGPQIASWPPIERSALALIDLSGVLAALPAIASITLIALVMMLMKVGAIGAMLNQEVDESRELDALALDNTLSAISGAMPGSHTVTGSQLMLRMGSADRSTIWLLLALVLLAVPFAGWTLAAMPRFLAAAILLWVGLELVVDWLHDHDGALSRRDVGVVALIALGIGLYGFPTGLMLGLACTVALFLVDYSRIDVLRTTLSPSDMRSNVDRSIAERAELDRRADALLVFRLRGYLFFGTAHRLLEQVRDEIAERRHRVDDPLCVILDFERVTGMDASTVRTLGQFRDLAVRSMVTVRVCADEGTFRAAFGVQGRAPATHGVHRHPQLDHALQAREERWLGCGRHSKADDARDFMSTLGGSLLEELAPRSRLLDLATGAALIEEGAPAEALYLVRSGRLEVRARRDGRHGAQPVRLRSVGPGALLGEVSLLLDGVASAGIVATEPSRVWRVSRRVLDELGAADPVAAARVHRLLATTLAQRLVDNGRQLRLTGG